MLDYIGDFPFLFLDHAPARVQQQWDIRARAGIDGVSMFKTGWRAEPFTIRGEAYDTNVTTGKATMIAYSELTDGAPVTIKYGDGVEESGHVYQVLRVDATCRAILAGWVAGDSTVYNCLIMSEWTLLPLFNIDQP